MFRRSRHVSIQVASDQLEEAVSFYQKCFGVAEVNRSGDGVELAGSNFTIWIDVTESGHGVVQEWVANDAAGARAMIEGAGGRVTGNSHCGFYVSDPYGMNYHVFIEDEVES